MSFNLAIDCSVQKWLSVLAGHHIPLEIEPYPALLGCSRILESVQHIGRKAAKAATLPFE